MEVLVEDVLYQPMRDEGTANSRHFLFACLDSCLVDHDMQPLGYGLPILADGEGQLCYQSIQSIEARCVFAVVPRCAGERQALIGEGVLQLMNL